jgi:Rps23 Pro-64 3,4-dihydroxylase Tpa1-like proline 4-hydroxylase
MNAAQNASVATTSEPVYPLDAEKLYLDDKQAAEIGQRFAQEYQSGKPFHYIAIDNFLPLEVLEKVRDEALDQYVKPPEHSSRHEHLKASYNPDTLPLFSRAVFNALNSKAFLKFLENMTGIPNLIPDPYYMGAGIHRTENEGFLGIHADFNHHKQMNLERRLNVLIYMNEDWEADYGGAFEVWTDDMKTQVAAFPPIMNRFCCFSTSSTSMHGNPEPVNHPNGQPRLSIALYYYTATWSDSHVAHSTLFRPRPGSSDQPASRSGRLHKIQRYTPPVLHPFVGKVLRKLRLV